MQLRQPSRLVTDLSHFLPVLRLYPLAMSFVYGTDPDSHLLGGWQFDPNKLNRKKETYNDASWRHAKARPKPMKADEDRGKGSALLQVWS